MHKPILSSKYIAPWALATENIPVHLMWDEPFEFDNIEIRVPSELEIVDFFNVDKVSSNNQHYIIHNLKTPNYFGFIVSTIKKISEIHIQRDISVNFMNKDKIILSETFKANIFRPVLKLLDSPKVFTLCDDLSKNNIDIAVELSGFGRVQVRNDISTGGKFRAKLEPLYHEIVRRIITTFDTEPGSNKKNGIIINPEFIQEKAEEFAGWMREGKIPMEFDNEDLKEFKTWIYNEKNYQKVIEILSKHIEEVLINSLIYFLERNPEDNVTMVQGKPSVSIDEFTSLIKFRIRYRDSMNNEYDPLLVEIDFNDIRKDKTKQIDIPINIKWKLNVINPIEYCQSGYKK